MENKQRVLNLISDTVTQPSDEMRRVMAAAEVGDDGYGADPTVNRLQELAAHMLGKEAALYVPSGTMSNLVAIGTHCTRGDEIICGDKAHIFMYEGAGASAYMGVSLCTLPNKADGTMELEAMQNAIRIKDPHFPRTKLVALENTHNTCGGRVLPVEYIRQVEQFCKDNELLLHVDGARLANASVVSGVPMKELVQGADSVSLCLSKGLGAPVGSILAGSAEFIERAKRLRQSLGGGMRQSGIVAAGALYALEHQMERLAEDHANAKALAEGLASIPSVDMRPEDVDSNIVFFKLAADAKLDATGLADKLKADKGVLLGGYYGSNGTIRAVINLHISRDDVEYVVASVRELLV